MPYDAVDAPYIFKKGGNHILVAEYDYDTDIAVQRQESLVIGIQQGIQQGISQGAYQKALETAKLMKQANCETNFIMQMTKLRKEEVEAIKG